MAFREFVQTDESDEFISSHCEVYTDDDGYFVSIETDSYEGHAMVTLPCAKKVLKALRKAIKFAEERRREKASAPK